VVLVFQSLGDGLPSRSRPPANLLGSGGLGRMAERIQRWPVGIRYGAKGIVAVDLIGQQVIALPGHPEIHRRGLPRAEVTPRVSARRLPRVERLHRVWLPLPSYDVGQGP